MTSATSYSLNYAYRAIARGRDVSGRTRFAVDKTDLSVRTRNHLGPGTLAASRPPPTRSAAYANVGPRDSHCNIIMGRRRPPIIFVGADSTRSWLSAGRGTRSVPPHNII